MSPRQPVQIEAEVIYVDVVDAGRFPFLSRSRPLRTVRQVLKRICEVYYRLTNTVMRKRMGKRGLRVFRYKLMELFTIHIPALAALSALETMLRSAR